MRRFIKNEFVKFSEHWEYAANENLHNKGNIEEFC